MQWLLNHQGSVTLAGVKMAAPSSVKTFLYSLSTCFQQLSREGPWRNDQSIGNPISCQRMRKWLTGYQNALVMAANPHALRRSAQLRWPFQCNSYRSKCWSLMLSGGTLQPGMRAHSPSCGPPAPRGCPQGTSHATRSNMLHVCMFLHVAQTYHLSHQCQHS